jgi:RimJ/RimL family protein N-acetyltransferase
VKPAPYRIETERLVIRCVDPADAEVFKEMIDESEEILRPFLWWYTGRSLDETVERLREFRSKFDADESYAYLVLEGDEPAGGAVLHKRIGPFGLEIGYWTRKSALRRGIAKEVTAVLMRVAFEHCGADRVELHIATGNEASLAVPRALGIPHEATLRRRWSDQSGDPGLDQAIFTLFRSEYGGGPPLRAYDALGRVLL